MTTSREEKLAIASIKLGQLLVRGDDRTRALLHNTPDGRRFIEALAPYMNVHIKDADELKAATPHTPANVDAYFDARWKQFNEGAERKRVELDARELRIIAWQKQVDKHCKELAEQVRSIPKYPLQLED